MARLTFPDEGSRLVYRPAGSALGTAAGAQVAVYSDAAGTTPADIQTTLGAAIPGSVLTVDSNSQLPLFLGPDGLDTVYVSANSGPVTAVYARADDRIDALAGPVAVSRVAGLRELTPLKETLTAAGGSCAVQVLGDSTGNDVTEWAYLLAQALATENPAWTVEHRVWNETTEDYSPKTRIQTGTTGDRYLDLSTGTTGRRMPPGAIPHLTGAIDLRVKLNAGDWSPATQVILLAKEIGAGSREWWMSLRTDGLLDFTFSTDGTNLTTVNSGVVTGFVDGTTGWVRCVFTPDDGAGNRTHKFYKSTDDGATWTQIGSTGTVAGAVAIFNAPTAPTYIGNRASAAAGTPAVKIYEVQIRDGVDGKTVAPCLPDLWARYGSVTDMQVPGAPVLTFVNGSRPGGTISYLNDSTRLPKMTPDYGQVVAFLSDSHNETQAIRQAFISLYAPWVTAVRARCPLAPVVVLTQNPESGATYEVEHAQRRRDLLTWARGAGVGVVDTFAAFLNAGVPIGNLLQDMVHPNATGSALWRDAVKAAYDAA